MTSVLSMLGNVRPRPMLAMCTALFCCCMNVILLEKMVKESPDCTVLVTFSGFVFIVLQGVCLHPEYLYNNQIPTKNYVFVTFLFFTTNVCNNLALSFEVDMPTVLIFRSGSLVANMVVSLIAFRRHYAVSKYVSVAAVTLGVFISTVATAKHKTEDHTTGSPSLTTWIIGLAMLGYGLFGSATMGVFQEKLFARFGKHPSEALFFNHLLGLIGFAVSYGNITRAVSDFNASPGATPLNIPVMWLYLLINVIMQTICVRSIYYLLSEWTSLAVTMVTTLRKFLSLLLSIVLFKNHFTFEHWISAGLVFAGSAMFSGVLKLPGEEALERILGRGKNTELV